jgi:hypothetical protein
VTADDIAALAPIPSPSAEGDIVEDLADLDRDVADFLDPHCTRPRLWLLGPIRAHLHGSRSSLTYRIPQATELLAFLMLHPHGVTKDQLVDAEIEPGRERAMLTELRQWLGRNPRTGLPHLPNKGDSRDAQRTGVSNYQVEDVLCDWDLFRALRARGSARGGAAGIEDLVTALRLVTGIPFTQGRPNGYAWLMEGERHDHIATIAILEVAATVITSAVAAQDLEMARFAAEVSHKAAPDDSQTTLNLLALAKAEGHGETAVAQLREALERANDYRTAASIGTRVQTVLTCGAEPIPSRARPGPADGRSSQ